MTKDNRSLLSSADNSTTGDIVHLQHAYTHARAHIHTQIAHTQARCQRVDLLLIQDSHDVIPVCDKSLLPYESIDPPIYRDNF